MTILNIEAAALRALQNAVATASDSRTAIHAVYIDLKEAHAVATNGHILVEYPLDDANLPHILEELAVPYADGMSIVMDKKVTAAWGRVALDFETGRAAGRKSTQTCGFRILVSADVGTYPAWTRISAHQTAGSTWKAATASAAPTAVFNVGILQKVTGNAVISLEMPYEENLGVFKVRVHREQYLVTFMGARWK